MTIDKNSIKKILCIKPRGIGDIVLSTIILENLYAAFKGLSVDYLTEDFAEEAVKYNPLVNKVLTMDKEEFPLKVARRVRKEGYDMILDLWSNPRSAQITFLSGVKYRVGFAYTGRKYAYNVLATSERGRGHSAEHNLELLKVIDVPVLTKNISFAVSDEGKNFADDFFSSRFPEEKNVIGIIPSGGWSSKRCDASKWVEICSKVLENYNVKFLILWGPGDVADSEFIVKNIKEAFLAPATSVSQMAGLINKCSLVIANDSGPMHISAALKVPTLGIFGPTNPENHGPYSPNSDYIIKDDLLCIICNMLECPYNHECMQELSNEAILEKIKSLLAKNKIRLEPNEKT